MAELIMSAFADEYCDSFSDQVKAMKDFGIGYIEIRFVDKKNVSTLTDREVEEAKAVLDKYGVKISSIGSPLGKINLNDDFDEHLALTRRVFEIAKKLDTNLVRIFSFYLPDGKSREECRSAVIERLEKMLELAEEYGITLCHENEAKIYGESPEMCLDLLSHFGGRLKAVFDMGNFVLDNYKPYPDAYEKLLPYIEYFHIKDSLYAGAIVPAGKGEAQIGEVLADYKRRGAKDTFITLEPHLETFSGLHTLKGRDFDNPYKFNSTEESFAVAVECLRGLM